jgi:hypothetical protein
VHIDRVRLLPWKISFGQLSGKVLIISARMLGSDATAELASKKSTRGQRCQMIFLSSAIAKSHQLPNTCSVQQPDDTQLLVLLDAKICMFKLVPCLV